MLVLLIIGKLENRITYMFDLARLLRDPSIDPLQLEFQSIF